MIDHLNNLLRHLLIAQINEIMTAGQVRFEPPVKRWREEVTTNNHLALNIDLVDLRQSRKRHSSLRASLRGTKL